MHNHDKIEILNNIGNLKKALIDAQHQWLATLGPGYTDETRASMVEAVATIEAELERQLLRAVAAVA